MTERRLRHADGEYRWLLIHRKPLRNADGIIVNWYGVAEDTEDRKFAEEKSPAIEQDLRATANTIPSLVWQAGPDGTLMTQPLDGSCGGLLCINTLEEKTPFDDKRLAILQVRKGYVIGTGSSLQIVTDPQCHAVDCYETERPHWSTDSESIPSRLWSGVTPPLHPKETIARVGKQQGFYDPNERVLPTDGE